jgi:hypothetical protein
MSLCGKAHYAVHIPDQAAYKSLVGDVSVKIGISIHTSEVAQIIGIRSIMESIHIYYIAVLMLCQHEPYEVASNETQATRNKKLHNRSQRDI